jgi:hypothetical protein
LNDNFWSPALDPAICRVPVPFFIETISQIDYFGKEEESPIARAKQEVTPAVLWIALIVRG